MFVDPSMSLVQLETGIWTKQQHTLTSYPSVACNATLPTRPSHLFLEEADWRLKKDCAFNNRRVYVTSQLQDRIAS